MNKKQKIIVSITGITLVLLILVGLTYAYFLTRIQGNTNERSISVSTKDLALVYEDGNGIISGNLIEPGTTLTSKTFTVTNTGNASTSYMVVIDDVHINYVTPQGTAGETTTFVKGGLVYTLNCISKNKNTNEVSGTCSKVEEETTLPLVNDGLLISNEIGENIRHEYSLTVTYKDTGENQSDDMNKMFDALVQIKDVRSLNPYSSISLFGDESNDSLAYNIINNSLIKKNGTELRSAPLTKPAKEVSMYRTGQHETVNTNSLDYGYDPWLVSNVPSDAYSGSAVSSYSEAVGKYVYDQSDDSLKYLESYDSSTNTLSFELVNHEKSLSVTPDDDGTSYYYRGAVEDNYVNFAEMCWRIVRIEGDGSIKLILEDQDTLCQNMNYNNGDGNWNISTANFGYTLYPDESLTASSGSTNDSSIYIMDYVNGQTNAANSMATKFKTFETNSLTSYLNKLKAGDWCINDKTYSGYNGNQLLTWQSVIDNLIGGDYINYDSYIRLLLNYEMSNSVNPTLKCNGNGTKTDRYANNTDMYVSTLTADEVAFAGSITNPGQLSGFNDTYLTKGAHVAFWTLSPTYIPPLSFGASTAIFTLGTDGLMSSKDVDSTAAIRPAVQLAVGTTISSGDGTQSNPYVIS